MKDKTKMHKLPRGKKTQAILREIFLSSMLGFRISQAQLEKNLGLNKKSIETSVIRLTKSGILSSTKFDELGNKRCYYTLSPEFRCSRELKNMFEQYTCSDEVDNLEHAFSEHNKLREEILAFGEKNSFLDFRAQNEQYHSSFDEIAAKLVRLPSIQKISLPTIIIDRHQTNSLSFKAWHDDNTSSSHSSNQSLLSVISQPAEIHSSIYARSNDINNTADLYSKANETNRQRLVTLSQRPLREYGFFSGSSAHQSYKAMVDSIQNATTTNVISDADEDNRRRLKALATRPY